jgi:hypothetical protein
MSTLDVLIERGIVRGDLRHGVLVGGKGNSGRRDKRQEPLEVARADAGGAAPDSSLVEQ